MNMVHGHLIICMHSLLLFGIKKKRRREEKGKAKAKGKENLMLFSSVVGNSVVCLAAGFLPQEPLMLFHAV